MTITTQPPIEESIFVTPQIKIIIRDASGYNGLNAQTRAIDVIAKNILVDLKPEIKNLFLSFENYNYSCNGIFLSYLNKLYAYNEDPDTIKFKKLLINIFNQSPRLEPSEGPTPIATIDFQRFPCAVSYFHKQHGNRQTISEMDRKELEAMLDFENHSISQYTAPYFWVRMLNYNGNLIMKIWIMA